MRNVIYTDTLNVWHIYACMLTIIARGVLEKIIIYGPVKIYGMITVEISVSSCHRLSEDQMIR